MDKSNTFRCSLAIILTAIPLSLTLSLLGSVELFQEKTCMSLVKFLIMFVLFIYLIISSMVKSIIIEQNSFYVFYRLRFYSRYYQCEHIDIQWVLCDCGKSNDIYFKIKRKTPFLFVKNKYVYFPCKNKEQMRDIVCLLDKEKVRIKFRGNKRTQKFIERALS